MQRLVVGFEGEETLGWTCLYVKHCKTRIPHRSLVLLQYRNPSNPHKAPDDLVDKLVRPDIVQGGDTNDLLWERKA